MNKLMNKWMSTCKYDKWIILFMNPNKQNDKWDNKYK